MTTFSFYRQKKIVNWIYIFSTERNRKNCHTCHWIRKSPENWGLSNDSLCDRNDSFAAGVTVPPIRSNCSRTRGTGQGVKKTSAGMPRNGTEPCSTRNRQSDLLRRGFSVQIHFVESIQHCPACFHAPGFSRKAPPQTNASMYASKVQDPLH